MFAQLLLGISGAMFFGLGVISWYDPEIPAEWAGLFISTHDAYAEIAAVYGGLQLALGSILLASAILREYLKAGLWLLFVCIGYIAVARGTSVLRKLGSSLHGADVDPSIEITSGYTIYTWGTLGLEFTIALLALMALLTILHPPK